ncbi:SRPBCC family protein [Flagellimonas marina]|uniref:SRPBCC family protein n=1 Tax=Flagellimonas marina TaxID=1775168 RepID=A0ABV8PNV4_9FLAO
MKTEKIKISSTIGSGIEKVWECWVLPEHITQWNFASDDWCCPKAENDLRVGGRYLARMEAKDDSFGFDFEAIYDEVEPMKKISYVMTDGRRAITNFESLGNEVKLTTEFDPENQNPIDMQRDGWQAILDNFKKYVENLNG